VTWSLLPERDEGVEARGAARWINTGENADPGPDESSGDE
jgi:hypothetical protein